MRRASWCGKHGPIPRTLNATIEKVFDAWVTSKALTKWFAPSDAFKTEVLELDVRPKGRYRIAMTHPDGKVHTVTGVYETIDRLHKLVFSWEWEKAESPNRSIVSISLKRRGDQTELTLVHQGLGTEESARHHEQDWNGCLGRLVAMF
jgi:uncharacterized protein YndB with AHSA1/START domain